VLNLVETGGKWRDISVSDVNFNLLRPLHEAIYNRLSRFDWLLRGEATAKRFSRFVQVAGQVFVSGDYESATNNLNIHIQEAILDGILENSWTVPPQIESLARRSQRTLLSLSRDEPVGLAVQQSSGQLMGNLLSFPLLCIVNYLGFRYFGGLEETRDLPVKINGDDIVFRAPEDVARRWMEAVSASGLKLSKGKTLVHKVYFSLNSRLFSSRGSVRALPAVRCTAMGYRPNDNPVASLSGRWRQVVKDFPRRGRVRVALASEFLRVNVKYVVASRRSLTRGLDAHFPYEAFAATGLWRREVWYLSLPEERPLPIDPETSRKARVPAGWESRRWEVVTREMDEVSKGAYAEFVKLACTPME
jgi:hypothetical protein